MPSGDRVRQAGGAHHRVGAYAGRAGTGRSVAGPVAGALTEDRQPGRAVGDLQSDAGRRLPRWLRKGGPPHQDSASDKWPAPDPADAPSGREPASGPGHDVLAAPGGRAPTCGRPGRAQKRPQLLPLLDKVPPVAGMVGRPRRRPDMLFTDRGYDHDKYQRLLWKRGIRPVIAERGQPHGSGLGIFRWVVERTISWFHGFRRLRVRWERRDDIHEAFLGLWA
ncbi:transposase [Streptomyces sp. NPDC014764]|uniref:transposase n=1 Tax=Streptomyces sp. NPDC014764 TaxID=3364907 RepID=UPI0036FC0C9A